jgi:hypothetical protein
MIGAMANGRARRPLGVTLIVVLTVVSGLLSLIGGLLILALHNNADLIRRSSESSRSLLVIGISSAVVGLIYLLVARGLARGNGFARFLVGFFSVLELIGGAYLAIDKREEVRTHGLVSALLALLILLLLYSRRANAFFRTN